MRAPGRPLRPAARAPGGVGSRLTLCFAGRSTEVCRHPRPAGGGARGEELRPAAASASSGTGAPFCPVPPSSHFTHINTCFACFQFTSLQTHARFRRAASQSLPVCLNPSRAGICPPPSSRSTRRSRPPSTPTSTALGLRAPGCSLAGFAIRFTRPTPSPPLRRPVWRQAAREWHKRGKGAALPESLGADGPGRWSLPMKGPST